MKTETKAKHTPGSWRIVGSSEGYEILGDSNGISSVVVAEVGRSIAPHHAARPIAEANARLIASAPELLSELKAMHSEYCADCKGGCPTLAIIAKAEGVTR